MNHLVIAAITALLAGSAGPTALDSRPETVAPLPVEVPLVTYNPDIQASLNRLWRASASWRNGVTAVAPGRRALILTPDQVVVRDTASSLDTAPFDPRVLAEVSPVVDTDGGVDVVLVVINLPLLESVHAERGSLPAELQDDLDRVVAHEVFGHALPYLLAGSVSGRCADPSPGQRATDACAIRRENIVRQELGLNRRTDAGLNGLMLAYRGRH